ncbi:MAG: 6-phosphogluconolactonase [Acidobacteria bacterium]|nr:MAG: 6-phosphogluconolactonase [Acidobacteriota bacterium]
MAFRPIVAADEGELARVAAAWLADEMRKAVARAGRCALAVSGGSTPRPAYERLAAQEDVPWEAVEVYFGDERAVPPSDAQSNYRMAREALLDRVRLSPDRIHPSALDILVLGMGPDGHTASPSPGSPALRETEKKVVPARAPVPPSERLTVTPPVIATARRVAVLAAGAGKAALVARVLRGPWQPDALPAQLAREGTWLLDRAAASALGS